MDLKKLSQFLAIVEAGSLSRAALRLHIAQPALTHAVQSLEQELGVPLLQRHARGVTLTEFGELLVDHARTILREVDHATTAIRERVSRASGSMRLAVPPILSGCLSRPILARLALKLPNVGVTLVERNAMSAREAVRSGACDFALTYAAEVEGDVSLRPVVVEKLAVAAKSGQLPRRPKMGLVDLAAFDIVLTPSHDPIRTIIDNATRRAGVKLKIVAEYDGLADFVVAIEDGRATLLPAYGLLAQRRVDFEVLTLGAPALDCCLFLMTSRNRTQTRSLAAFQTIVLETIETLVSTEAWPGRYVGHLPSDASMITIYSNAG